MDKSTQHSNPLQPVTVEQDIQSGRIAGRKVSHPKRTKAHLYSLRSEIYPKIKLFVFFLIIVDLKIHQATFFFCILYLEHFHLGNFWKKGFHFLINQNGYISLIQRTLKFACGV